MVLKTNEADVNKQNKKANLEARYILVEVEKTSDCDLNLVV